MQFVKLVCHSCINQKLKYPIGILLCLCLVAMACSNKITANVLGQEIERIQNILALKEDATLDIMNAKKLIDKSRKFSDTFPSDTLASVYLFRAADVARGIGQYELAVQLWGEVQQKYPAFIKVPDALFMQGFTLENNLKNTKLAKEHYEQFVEQYPQHHLINTVQASLKNLNKSLEELIKEFQKNN